MCYVYALRSSGKGLIYIGQTKDLPGRIQCHNKGYVRSTRNGRPWELIAFEKLKSINEARWIENGLKRSQGKRMKWLEEKRLAQ
jgi:predicted GIY-YIG superfamily endonuclease